MKGIANVASSARGAAVPAGPDGALERARELLPELTGALSRVAEQVLADPAGTARATIMELAERSGTSPASVTRFCRALGFTGYADLRLTIAAETGWALISAPPPDQTPPVSGAALLAAARDAIDGVVARQSDAVTAAADLLAEAIERGGVIQAYGSGHSQAIAMEIAGRAGGLVPTNRLALRDLVMFGGANPDILLDPKLERDPDTADQLYALAGVQPADVFVIVSNSGINGSVVQLALIAKEKGHGLVAITSSQHTRQVEPRHPSGFRLADIADVVLDNGAPFGDAILPMPAGGTVCAVSTVTAALLAQMIVAEVVRRLLDRGETPPVYLSVNVPDGDEHNRELEARYAGRIRRTA